MKVLALDLSLSCTGWVLGEYVDGEVVLLEKGLIDNRKLYRASQAKRLFIIGQALTAIFKANPDIDKVVREQGFTKGNVATQALFKVAGVADFISYNNGHKSIEEITVGSIRKLVVGNGKASKAETAAALEFFVGEQEYASNDESDAVAVLIGWGILKEQVSDW